jgi:ABC-type lipopolysaccharide export system ATPase subunit
VTETLADTPVAPVVATDGLVAENLVRYYGKWQVVKGVSFNVRRGEVVGLLGPNGAGKSTTFHMVVGLLRPNGGTIKLDGREITGEPVYRRARLGLGYLAQEPSIFRKLTVRENVMAVLETMPLTTAQRESRLDELLADLNLTHLAGRHATSSRAGSAAASRSRARCRASRRSCCSTSRSWASTRSPSRRSRRSSAGCVRAAWACSSPITTCA